MATLLDRPVTFGPGLEHFNPTRRYYELRPRQAARGVITLSGPTNNATLSLYNSGSGPQLLVVRAYAIFTAVSHLVLIARQKGTVGASGGTIAPMIADSTPPPGALYSQDTASALTPDFFVTGTIGSPVWGYEFPFDILEPNWSLSFQDTTAAETMRLAVMWEAIFPDELDYFTTQKHG